MKTLNQTTFLHHTIVMKSICKDYPHFISKVKTASIFDLIPETILFIGLKDGTFAVYSSDFNGVEKFISFDEVSNIYGVDKTRNKLDKQTSQLIVDIFKHYDNNNVDIDNIYGGNL